MGYEFPSGALCAWHGTKGHPCRTIYAVDYVQCGCRCSLALHPVRATQSVSRCRAGVKRSQGVGDVLDPHAGCGPEARCRVAEEVGVEVPESRAGGDGLNASTDVRWIERCTEFPGEHEIHRVPPFSSILVPFEGLEFDLAFQRSHARRRQGDAPVLVPFRRNVRPSLMAAPYIIWPVSPHRAVALSNDPQGEKAVMREATGKLVGMVRLGVEQGRERMIFASDGQHDRLPSSRQFRRRAQV